MLINRPKIRALRGAACLLLSGFAAACTGAVNGGQPLPGQSLPAQPSAGAAGSNAGSMTGSAGTAPVQSLACASAAIQPGRSPLRRLNHIEYDATVHDLLGAGQQTQNFPPDEQGAGFSNNADALTVSSLLAEGYQSAAGKMAADAVSHLSTFSSCDATASGEDTCAEQLLRTLGKRAFRRPLSQDEVTRYLALYKLGRNAAAYTDGMSLMLQALLESPHFLYRVEGAPAAGSAPAPVSAYEMASRLSYFLWGSMPDDALFAAADQNQLATNEQLTSQVQRLLQDPRAKTSIATLHREWLELTSALEAPKAAMLYPTWNPALAADLFKESQLFVDDVFWNDGNVSSLLSGSSTFVNASLANFYGVAPSSAPQANGFGKVSLAGAPRLGLLTQGTFLAAHAGPDQSSPVRRGKFIREQLLCQPVPPPPNNIVIKPPTYDPGSSTRERFVQHEKEPICVACHANMDPLGFAFEGYDAIGGFRTTDGPHPVDAHGTLSGTDVDGDFKDGLELVGRLATSKDVAACVATQWFRYAHGRTEGDQDSCAVAKLEQDFADKHYDMRALPLAIVLGETFRYRAPIGDTP